MWSEVGIHQGDKTDNSKKTFSMTNQWEECQFTINHTTNCVLSRFRSRPAQQYWHIVLRRRRVMCNVLSPLFSAVKYPPSPPLSLPADYDPTLHHPVPWVVPIRNFAFRRSGSTQMSGNGALYARLPFCRCCWPTKQHSQAQLSPAACAATHRSHRSGRNICLITLLTFDRNVCATKKTALPKPHIKNRFDKKETALQTLQKWTICSKQEYFTCYKDVLSGVLILIWIPKKSAVSSLALKQEVELWLSSARLV